MDDYELSPDQLIAIIAKAFRVIQNGSSLCLKLAQRRPTTKDSTPIYQALGESGLAARSIRSSTRRRQTNDLLDGQAQRIDSSLL
jgi:hypothetical protein